MLRGGEHGAAIVPGEPDRSPLIEAVRYANPDLQMPPKGEKLTDAQVADLVAWVKSGGAPPPEPFQQDNRASGRSPDQLVDDLGAIFRLMQDLEDDLLSSPETLMRHETKLQNLDIAMQMLSALAREVKPESADPTRSMARLEDLRAVCDQALRPKSE